MMMMTMMMMMMMIELNAGETEGEERLISARLTDDVDANPDLGDMNEFAVELTAAPGALPLELAQMPQDNAAEAEAIRHEQQKAKEKEWTKQATSRYRHRYRQPHEQDEEQDTQTDRDQVRKDKLNHKQRHQHRGSSKKAVNNLQSHVL